ncbi:hypothetical protein cyc_06979 [Cyclospora cayetanensis]|uniref:Uncharacterized protein n=1 Tax=Cyclospora cayetanensis TaxID=88456 RepID=A0A1D3CYC8_9EIME|nr:hypothetical protein cyc_06979 [Cyclospora cayetanensis]
MPYTRFFVWALFAAEALALLQAPTRLISAGLQEADSSMDTLTGLLDDSSIMDNEFNTASDWNIVEELANDTHLLSPSQNADPFAALSPLPKKNAKRSVAAMTIIAAA